MSRAFVRTLKHNMKNERPSHVLFFDVESDLVKIDKNKYKFIPFLWTGIYKHYRYGNGKDTEIELSGTTLDSFWGAIEDYSYPKTKLYVVSHHLEVDFLPLGGFTYLNKYGWTLNSLISHGRVVTLYCKRLTTSLIIMNNGNLFDGSIEQWGNTFGVPKLTMPSNRKNMGEWVTYCKRDTLILKMMWDKLLEFMDQHDLGNFKASRASLAMNAFRHRFMNYEINIHDDPVVTVLERDSYHGGRFEALKIGDFTGDTYYQLDTNSMYGYIESSCMLPYALQGYEEEVPIDKALHLLKSYSCIATCLVDTNEPYLPVKVETKVKYLTGKHIITMCTPELLYALKHKQVKHIYYLAYYKQGLIFKEYADYFMQLKDQYTRENNLPMRTLAKFFPNALYGKFGQYGYDDKVIGECDPEIFKIEEGYNVETKKRYTIMSYGGKVHQTITTDSSYYTFVAIASHITAYGRMMLYKMMKRAGLSHVYHVATDSVVVDSIGYKRLQSMIDPVKPGYLKLEKTFTNYSIKGINDVVTDGQEKIKGIPKKATKIDDNTYICTNWPRITTLIKEGMPDTYYTRTVVKHLNRPDYKEFIRQVNAGDTSIIA